MALLKRAATVAVLAGAGVVATAGLAAADACCGMGHGHGGGDNNTTQSGLIPVSALNNVNVSPNAGCLGDQLAKDPNVLNSLIGLVPINVDAAHALENPELNVLANGNVNNNITDDSCTSNQGSSQAGDNSRGSTGAGSSSTSHSVGDKAGSGNKSGNGAGGLLGDTGILGTGLGL
jgi:hypothetical protein